MPFELALVFGAIAALLGALAVFLALRARPGSALALHFHETTATALRHLIATYGNEWYQRWLMVMDARLRDTNGEPPEAVVDTAVVPNRWWLLIESVMVTYVRNDLLPSSRGRGDVTRRLRRWWCGYPCEVIVTAVADPLALPVA